MWLASYSDVFAISHERHGDVDIGPGQLVRTGLNAFPLFRVVAVDGGKAWLRDEQSGADALAPLARCHPVKSDAFSIAAE